MLLIRIKNCYQAIQMVVNIGYLPVKCYENHIMKQGKSLFIMH